MLCTADINTNDIWMTWDEIGRYIKAQIPGISNDDMRKIRELYVWGDERGHHFHLDSCIFMYKRHKQIVEWNKRKDRDYYIVSMCNGGTKIVFMCEEMVKDFYGHRKYTKITKRTREDVL